MDPLKDEICHGCLNSERKLSNLHDCSLKECFKLILKKATVSMETIQLCFECVAILMKIKRFQERVISSENLWKSLKKSTLRSQTSLQKNNLYNFSLLQHTSEENCEIIQTSLEIKNENEDLEDIDRDEFKQEIEDFSTETDIVNEELKLDLLKDLTQKEIYTEVKLSREEIEKEREEIKVSDAYLNAMLKCELCITTFTNNEDLKEHISDKHGEKTKHICTICKCTFNSSISFKYHTDRHKKRYQCTVCNIRFLYRRDVIKHFNFVHCHGVENITYENGTHERLEAPPDIDKQDLFSCDVCEKSFRWKASLRKHMEGHRIASGQKRKPYCEPCKIHFATTANLKKHVRMSSKHQIQLKLRKLKDSNEDKSDVIKEIRTSVNSARETYSCSQCDKKFQWHGNLMRHMNSHRAKASGELVCMPCNRSFSSIATYQQHMKISKKHVSENDFKYMCSDCGKRFADKTRLKDHIDWEHLKNFKHTCSDCQKAFKTRTSLYLHKQVVHQRDTSEHLCDTCGKHFPNHSKLRIHIRAVHSSVAAYKCTSCGAKFAWHSCLSRHMRRLHKKHV
ncbi:zinc finger protein 431-like isoform X2 [Pieris brassicae]|nr:zinc finger protein 431-like isoform X2 [Pieris brassicae]